MAYSIIGKKYVWAAPLVDRIGPPKGIVPHHSASKYASPDDIHRWHLGRGWSGIGYHAVVRKSGLIYRGRPWRKQGCHALGHNDWLGIVFEGNFEVEKMGLRQKLAGRWLVRRWKRKFDLNNNQVRGHRSLGGNSTACPGKNFPMKFIKS